MVLIIPFIRVARRHLSVNRLFVSARHMSSSAPLMSKSHSTAQTFKDANISSLSKKGIQHEFMTDVQAATLGPALDGHDLIVQAKTGTGKTLAFLLPAIERLVESRSGHVNGIHILVIAPTRELALQIKNVANPLLDSHGLSAQHVIGGTNINSERKQLGNSACHILVATPGRLLDHLKDESNPLRRNISNVKCLIYDEADRLLDQGFRADLEKLQHYLPPKNTRQHLLFSATFSEDIKSVAKVVMNPGVRFISTLKADEVNTHLHVPQSYYISPHADHFATLLAVLIDDVKRHGKKSKCMCFFTTAQQTKFAEALFEQLRKKNPSIPRIFALHSRKSQPARLQTAKQFENAKEGWLMSSDVTARGMDFPDVTLVAQIGFPSSPDQYIHRLGRTARAGADGRGVIILDQDEKIFLQRGQIQQINIEQGQLENNSIASAAGMLQPIIAQADQNAVRTAYQSWLGYYKGTKVFRTPAALVSKGNEVARAWGWRGEASPPISSMVVGKMGIKGVPGVNVVKGKVAMLDN